MSTRKQNNPSEKTAMNNSAIDKEGYLSVHASNCKGKYIALVAGGLPLSLSSGHKLLLGQIGVDWMTAKCLNVEFFYTGKGKSIREFLNNIA